MLFFGFFLSRFAQNFKGTLRSVNVHTHTPKKVAFALPHADFALTIAKDFDVLVVNLST